MGVWVLEEFDRATGDFRVRHTLGELSDGDARSLLDPADLGSGYLFDVPEASLAELARRFGLMVDPRRFEYLLGQEASAAS